MRNRVLCVTDLTKRSDDAVARAVRMARSMKAQVTFLHAVSDAHSGRVIRMKVNRAHARLLVLADRAMRESPFGADVCVRIGTPLQVIAAVANESEVDIIVMAAPQRRRVDYWLGTTAERVIRATRRPVLIVSRPSTGDYERVLLASDLTVSAQQVAKIASDMGVLDADFDLNRIRVMAPATPPFDAICSALESTSAELLVVGTSRWFALKRLLFSSVADDVLRNASCDVLAISAAGRHKLNRTLASGTDTNEIRMPTPSTAFASSGSRS